MRNRLYSLLRECAWFILRTVHPQPDEIDAALRGAFQDAGLAADNYAVDFDPGPKRLEVLHYAAERLGNPLRTVRDIRRLLE